MQVFSATLNQMFVLFTFMALGYFLNYKSILPLNSSIAVSRLETNVLVPCLVFNTFYKYLGLNTVVFPAAYDGDTTPGASMALISHVMSIITIPVMFAIFI